MKTLIIATLVALLALPLSREAEAGRAPNAEELAKLEQVLHDLGFTSWDEIELEGNGTVWEVSDAIGPDGFEYDLELRFGTLEVVKKDRD